MHTQTIGSNNWAIQFIHYHPHLSLTNLPEAVTWAGKPCDWRLWLDKTWKQVPMRVCQCRSMVALHPLPDKRWQVSVGESQTNMEMHQTLRAPLYRLYFTLISHLWVNLWDVPWHTPFVFADESLGEVFKIQSFDMWLCSRSVRGGGGGWIKCSGLWLGYFCPLYLIHRRMLAGNFVSNSRA